MILQNFKYFGFFDAIEMGLYMVVVGYDFLLFAYFLIMRFRITKKPYWLFFSILFLFLAIARVFFITYYFFVPEMSAPKAEIVRTLMITYRLATLFSWLGVACFMGILGILLFPPETENEKSNTESQKFNLPKNLKLAFRICLIGLPIFIGFLALILPDNLLMDPDIAEDYNVDIHLITVWGYPAGRLLFLIFAVIFNFLIPFVFLYLAVKTFGVLRKSYALNAIGIFLYYLGRTLQGVFEIAALPHFKAIVPPLIILSSLLIIVIANSYEQLR